MSLHWVAAANDPRLACDHALPSQNLTAASGRFIAEGNKVVERLIESRLLRRTGPSGGAGLARITELVRSVRALQPPERPLEWCWGMRCTAYPQPCKPFATSG